MVSGHTQAIDSAPIKANASMESVVLKVPATSVESHLKKVAEENRENAKRSDETVSRVQVTAPEHHLKRVENTIKTCGIIGLALLEHPTKKHNCLAT